MVMAQTIRKRSRSGFSLVEMLVAITVTLIIMGSVYGLMAQGQSAFGREPLLADRQQQIRIAMDRIQKDLLVAGMSLGSNTQAFATGLDALGPVGVRAAADTALGGGNSDYLEVRTPASDCPPVRLTPLTEIVGTLLNTVETFPACYTDPGFVFLLYPDGQSKLGWLQAQKTGEDQSNFDATQPTGSQMGAVATHFPCSVWFGTTGGLVSPNGSSCPPAPVPPDSYGCPGCRPYAVQLASVVRYQVAMDTNGTVATTDDIPSLFRHTNGGLSAAGAPTTPPGTGWQLVARGIEDLQVEYRSANSAGWVNTPAFVAQNATGDIVQEVRVTLWARAVGVKPQEANNVGDGLQGEYRAPGNLVMAVRGSLVTTVAPRAAQRALAGANQWK
jgi:prepilin-type N-terminal cleavage/methylation domain-containing protein